MNNALKQGKPAAFEGFFSKTSQNNINSQWLKFLSYAPPHPHSLIPCRLGWWFTQLRQGGWHDGCLRGQSLVNVSTNMSLILHFDRPGTPRIEGGTFLLARIHWKNMVFVGEDGDIVAPIR